MRGQDLVTRVYLDKRGQVSSRYVRLLTLGRFEIALTWVEDSAPGRYASSNRPQPGEASDEGNESETGAEKAGGTQAGPGRASRRNAPGPDVSARQALTALCLCGAGDKPFYHHAQTCVVFAEEKPAHA